METNYTESTFARTWRLCKFVCQSEGRTNENFVVSKPNDYTRWHTTYFEIEN